LWSESLIAASRVRTPEGSIDSEAHEDVLMKSHYTAVIKNTGDWWIGWIEEVPGVNCQERTREELVETLRITLKEALDVNREEALASAGADFQEEKIAV
jgi:predicted RNase H-like HicB family nuclease